MACKGCSCSTGGASKEGDTAVAGCGSNGCSSGGCNRMNTYDWLAALDIEDAFQFDIVEISFKNGTRKEFFKNPSHTRAMTGDMVLVESDNNGYDLGRISLSGDLVRLQMKKRNVKEKTVLQSVIRRANERDLERLQEAREAEKPTMIQARAISRSLGLDMKISDVEYQGDKRKATFFYIADGRVDFRELIREYARDFKVKIEMRQIGARQESARVGGLGPCGRELCCSTWLTDFKSVSTLAARYQNLAINQSKLSGQCGRLKCCLNFELDSYIDALENFPNHADKIFTEEGAANLMKTDIFKGLMYYCYEKDHGRGKFYPLEIEQVKEVLEANKMGMKPVDLSSIQLIEDEEDEVGFDGDLTGVVELPNEKKKKKKKSKRKPAGDAKKSFSFAKNPDDKSAPNNNNQPSRDKRPDSRNDNRGENKPEARNENRPDNRNDRRPPREDRDPNAPQRRDDRPRNEQRPQNPNQQGQRPPQNNRPERTVPREPNDAKPKPENPNVRPPNQEINKEGAPNNNPNKEQRPNNNNRNNRNRNKNRNNNPKKDNNDGNKSE